MIFAPDVSISFFIISNKSRLFSFAFFQKDHLKIFFLKKLKKIISYRSFRLQRNPFTRLRMSNNDSLLLDLTCKSGVLLNQQGDTSLMSKSRYVLVCALATISLLAIVAIEERPEPLKATGTSTTYSRSVTLTPEMLPSQRGSENYTITLQGLALSLGKAVYRSGDYIVLDGNETDAFIEFPPYLVTASPHGVGYSNMRFGLARGGVNDDLAIQMDDYDTANSFFPKTGTLSSTSPLDISIGGTHNAYPLIHLQNYNGSFGCAFSYLTAIYICSAN